MGCKCMQMNPPFPLKSLTEFAVPPPRGMETLNKYKKIAQRRTIDFLREGKKREKFLSWPQRHAYLGGYFPSD